MNYYEHHLGDYAQATAHLTFVEDAAYSRMLRKYYAEEKPLPVELRAVQRLVAARTDEEREAVEVVLAEFFTLESDGWHNKRADKVIQAYHGKQVDADAKRDNEAERQRRHRARRKELFDALRSYGEVPKFDTTMSDLEAMLSRVTDGVGHALLTEPVTRDATANQSPVTSNQTPEDQKKARATPARPDDVIEQTWKDWLALRRAKKAPVTETVLKQARAEADKAGLPLTRFLEIWCARGSQGLQADWLKPHERAGPDQRGRPSTSANFRDKTYTGTNLDDLPASLRPAA